MADCDGCVLARHLSELAGRAVQVAPPHVWEGDTKYPLTTHLVKFVHLFDGKWFPNLETS